ncbi:hypothetical protein [Chryseobacterium potabilaquae]|uniref:Leucine-rich repeat domain-containing protein n=1 Tax=Chryseobacterium potabilaquae TaxID=2675057 RepID=A0A6N4X0W0_9FLAO|nr:hypothetical protein [Chryseobacterium potabilaquae]CAA7193829.1 hypothetical protein CHRY9293_00240 [Chryseobacterium potabilaquae]
MDTNIYYIPEHEGILITSNFAEIQKWMNLGVNPKVEYIPISISDLNKYTFKGIGFEKVSNEYFQSIKEIFSEYKFDDVCFHESTVDLSDVIFDVRHFVIGDKSNINLSEKNFKNLEEVTFLSLKTFKGKIVTKLNSVKKIVLWFENKKGNTLLSHFPRLKELHIFNGSEVELDLVENKDIENLRLGNLPKLEKIIFNSETVIKKAIIENCKKLDTSELPK